MSDNGAAISVLRTKLHRPPVVANHLHRQRLLDRLNRHRNRPLTLVSAPAGYGKSMLVSHWLETCDMRSGWISLDENDDDLRAFTTYFIAAVESLFPGACRKTQTMINGPNLPPVAELGFTLLNELDRIAQPCIMFHAPRGSSRPHIIRAEGGRSICDGISFQRGLRQTTPANQSIPIGYRHP